MNRSTEKNFSLRKTTVFPRKITLALNMLPHDSRYVKSQSYFTVFYVLLHIALREDRISKSPPERGNNV
jgi:hypothetical protein